MKFKKGEIVVHRLGKTCLVIDGYQAQDGFLYDVRDYNLNVYLAIAEFEFKKSSEKKLEKK